MRGRGGGRNRHGQQLLGIGTDHGTGAGARPESGGVVSCGEQQRTGRQDDVYGIGNGEKRWDEASVVTTMRFYRSTDATITTSDTEVGTAAVGGLSPTGTGSRSATSSNRSGMLASTVDSATTFYHGELELNAPSTPGTYYYGACVDAVTDESDTTNNCSSSAQVTVRSSEQQVPGAPDLNPYTIVVEAGLDGLSPEGSFPCRWG